MPKLVAGKNDWITLGFQLIAQEGMGGVVVEKMAKKLNCNKSSFYWHFKSKKEFIYTIVEHWVAIETEQIIATTNQEATANQKFETLIKIVFKKDPTLDFIFYLKRYGQKDKSIQNLIDNIDQQRIAYVTTLLEDLGNEKAVIKANLFYKYLIGYHEMIRYKKQTKNYIEEVKQELQQFIQY